MKKKFIPLAILLIIIMCMVSAYACEKEIIFPEVSALVISAWILTEQTSENKSFHFWISPTIGALTGMLINRFLPSSTILMVAVAFILVFLQLKIIGSEVYPALSASILPILLHSESWYYPLSVCILTGIIALGNKLIISFYSKKTKNSTLNKNMNKQIKVQLNSKELVHWAKLLISVLLVLIIALYFNCNYIIAPPLIVVFVELCKPKSKLRRNRFLTFILPALSAFLGVVWLYLMFYLLHLPIWISACLSVSCVLLIFHLLQFSLPPAAALSLLPSIIPARSLWAYPLQVLVGSVLLLIINLLWFRNTTIFNTSVTQKT
ncbi:MULTISPECIES: HPP family protein [Clostridium]|uniref:HPP family protein n=1 Tax=Clostridium TaxID=1485 RepID=UPI000824897F|nr:MULTISPECIES: HPP family protein [Clostridium]